MAAFDEKREFLHSISRITDRFVSVVRQCSHVVNEANEIKQEVLELQEDILKLQQAIESIFNDLLKNENG
jgi:hypothetical protein